MPEDPADPSSYDLFAPFYDAFTAGSDYDAWARHVPVFDGSKICERKGRKVGRKTGSI